MREPIHRQPVGGPGWNERAAVALLVVLAGHLRATTPAGEPLTPDRLARLVAAYQDDLPALVAAPKGSPSAQVRQGAQQLSRLLRAGQAQVYRRILPGLPVALAVRRQSWCAERQSWCAETSEFLRHLARRPAPRPHPPLFERQNTLAPSPRRRRPTTPSVRIGAPTLTFLQDRRSNCDVSAQQL